MNFLAFTEFIENGIIKQMELNYDRQLKIVAQKELFVMGCRRPVPADSSFCVVI